MKFPQPLVGASGALLLLFGVNLPSFAKVKSVEDPIGQRFLCNDAPNRLCLPFLLPGCRLTIRAGQGIPSAPEDKAILLQNNEGNTIDNPNQFRGCVKISTPAQALEYLRFFSSLGTVHLFRDKILEIYPLHDKKCYLVCLPERRWHFWKLQSPLVEKTNSGFRVTRTVIRPIPNRQQVTVFRITQEVGTDGTVSEIESVPVSLPAADLLWLGFPSYL